MEYLHKVCRSPLRPIHCDLESASDKLFSEIKTQIPNPPLHDRARQDWISNETWLAMDARVIVLWEGAHRTVQKLIRRILAGLGMYHNILVEEIGHTIDSLLASDPPPCQRGMGTDVGVLQRCGQQTPTPGACIPGNPDGITCGTICLRTSTRDTYYHRFGPLPSG